jgi:hypothetical protein
MLAAEQAGVPLNAAFLGTLDTSMPPASLFITQDSSDIVE